MPDFHRLDPAADAPFLRRGTADPLSRVAFRPTNAVVMCATCGLVSLRETWEACGGCPNGHATAAPWDAAAAERASGDGASRAVAPPLPARPGVAPIATVPMPAYSEPEPTRRTGLWIVLGVVAALLAALGVATLLNRDETPAQPGQAATTAGPSAPQSVAVEAGETVGALDDSDFRAADGRYQDLYAFRADSSGRTLTFTVSSDAFYPDLVVTGPDSTANEAQTVTTDNDDESDTRTVSVRGLRGPGLYQVLISSRRPQATGGYSLQIRQEDPVVALPVNGRQVAGELTRRSVKADDRYRDTYSFTGAADREHTITVKSDAFTPTVVVSGPSGSAVRGASAPTSGGTVYKFTPTAAGSYRVVVSTRETDRTGTYTVLLAVAAPPPPAPTPRTDDADAAPSAGALRAGGAPVRDSLAAGDSRTYSASGRVGDRVSVEVRATGFTPTLTIIGPDGQRTPATADGDRARARVTLPADGRFRVVVGSAGGSGTYSVSLEQQAGVTATPIPRTPGADVPRAPAPPPSTDPADVKQPLPDPNYRPQPLGGTN